MIQELNYPDHNQTAQQAKQPTKQSICWKNVFRCISYGVYVTVKTILIYSWLIIYCLLSFNTIFKSIEIAHISLPPYIYFVIHILLKFFNINLTYFIFWIPGKPLASIDPMIPTYPLYDITSVTIIHNIFFFLYRNLSTQHNLYISLRVISFQLIFLFYTTNRFQKDWLFSFIITCIIY